MFGLFVRHCYMAAGHNALRRSGSCQNRAVSLLQWLNWSVPIFGSTGWVHYSSGSLSNLVSASDARACFKLPARQVPCNMFRVPSSPRPCVRSCWPVRWRRFSLIGVPVTWTAMVCAYIRPAWPAGSQRGRRPRATFVSNGCPLWRCARDAPCHPSSSASAPIQSTPPDHALI